MGWFDHGSDEQAAYDQVCLGSLSHLRRARSAGNAFDECGSSLTLVFPMQYNNLDTSRLDHQAKLSHELIGGAAGECLSSTPW